MVNINLNVLKCCSSTNDVAFNAALKGEAEGSSYLAYTQTNGRGRNKNKWTSMKGNLFLSTIIKPKKDKLFWNQLSVIVGYSIIQVLTNLGVNRKLIELKWPNDVLVDKRKISGVLLESSENFIIVGLGVNILKNPNLKTKWVTTKLKEHVSKTLPIEGIASMILKKVFKNYFNWEKYGFKFFIKNINKNIDNINKNIIINVHPNTNPVIGIFLGLGDNGGLKVKTDSKVTEYYSVESFSFV